MVRWEKSSVLSIRAKMYGRELMMESTKDQVAEEEEIIIIERKQRRCMLKIYGLGVGIR